MRKTILFGNGLGMSLDPTYFLLKTALKSVWDLKNRKDSPLSIEEKKRIKILTNISTIKAPPENESQLLTLHRVITACQFLNKFKAPNIQWLNTRAKSFPKAIEYFISKSAAHFQFYEGGLSNDFMRSLTQEITRSNSHIVTLNYDNLLYGDLIKRNILDGYNGYLIDGLLRKGFDESNLERRYGKNFGWYLHLHGSPLFVQEGDKIFKLDSRDLRDSLKSKRKTLKRHLVLTHFKMKAEVITQSRLLSAYWTYFEKALAESKKIYIVGYSGADPHVNEEIYSWSQIGKRQIEVIEWEGAGKLSKRIAFWKKKFMINNRTSFNLTQLENIQDYRW